MQTDYSMVNAALQYGGVIKNCVDLETGEVLPLPGREEASAGPRTGLSKVHISPQAGRITFYKNGTLIKCRKLKYQKKERVNKGGIRGKITGFSKASRRRMMYMLGRVKRADVPLFVTLTYPDQYSVDLKDWTKHIDKLRKRMARRGWGAIWRKEFKVRKSGTNKGKLAPHFHLLVWGVSYFDLFAWLSSAWYQIVGSGDPKHLSAGTRVEKLKNIQSVMRYIGKYINKDEKENLEEFLTDNEIESFGRMWGVINEDAIPFDEAVSVVITYHEASKLMRLMRRYMKTKKKLNLPTLHMLCNDPGQWFDRLDRLLDRFFLNPDASGAVPVVHP